MKQIHEYTNTQITNTQIPMTWLVEIWQDSLHLVMDQWIQYKYQNTQIPNKFQSGQVPSLICDPDNQRGEG